MLLTRHNKWLLVFFAAVCMTLFTSGCGGGSGSGGGGPFYGHADLSRGLIYWWKFNGDATDSAGSLSTTPIGPVTYTRAVAGQGIVFNGTTTGINLPEVTDMQFQGSFSISAWAELYSYQNPSELWSTVIFCGDDRNGLDPYYIQVDPYGTLQFEVCGMTQALGINATMQFPLNKFVFITGTYDKSAGIERIYVNGKLDSENLPDASDGT